MLPDWVQTASDYAKLARQELNDHHAELRDYPAPEELLFHGAGYAALLHCLAQACWARCNENDEAAKSMAATICLVPEYMNSFQVENGSDLAVDASRYFLELARQAEAGASAGAPSSLEALLTGSSAENGERLAWSALMDASLSLPFVEDDFEEVAMLFTALANRLKLGLAILALEREDGDRFLQLLAAETCSEGEVPSLFRDAGTVLAGFLRQRQLETGLAAHDPSLFAPEV